MKNKKMKDVERIFNVAEEALEGITIGEEEKILDDKTRAITVTAEVQFDVEEVIEEDELALTETGEVFGLGDLKKDFIITKRSLMKLNLQLQSLMDQTTGLDLEEMSGIKLGAIAQLAKVVQETTISMLSLYKMISDIEKDKRGGDMGGFNANVLGNLNQNIIYTGTSADLLKTLKNSRDENL